jgi:hypothetical protein
MSTSVNVVDGDGALDVDGDGDAIMVGDNGHQSVEPSSSQDSDNLLSSQASKDMPSAREARQCRRIAQLEQKLVTLEAGRAVKER